MNANQLKAIHKYQDTSSLVKDPNYKNAMSIISTFKADNEKGGQ